MLRILSATTLAAQPAAGSTGGWLNWRLAQLMIEIHQQNVLTSTSLLLDHTQDYVTPIQPPPLLVSRVGLAGLELPQDKVVCTFALSKFPPADSVADRTRTKNLFITLHHITSRQTKTILSHAAHLHDRAVARPEQAADGRHAVSKLRRLGKT